MTLNSSSLLSMRLMIDPRLPQNWYLPELYLGSLTLIQFFKDNGALIDAKDASGYTPADVAHDSGNDFVIQPFFWIIESIAIC